MKVNNIFGAFNKITCLDTQNASLFSEGVLEVRKGTSLTFGFIWKRGIVLCWLSYNSSSTKPLSLHVERGSGGKPCVSVNPETDSGRSAKTLFKFTLAANVPQNAYIDTSLPRWS